MFGIEIIIADYCYYFIGIIVLVEDSQAVSSVVEHSRVRAFNKVLLGK